MTTVTAIRFQALSAVAAGILFMAIQPIHPPDTLASVTTATWTAVHIATLAMLALFVVGVLGIHRRQAAATGWLGRLGVISLVTGLVITAAMVFVEAFVSPVLAVTDPAFVESLLGMVDGSGGTVDLGALPLLWTVSSVLFPLGCLTLGIAALRAGVLPRWASATFAFGLPVTLGVVSLLPGDLHRLGAMPIGLGLAGLGYAVWRERSTAQPADQMPAARVLPVAGRI